MCGWWVSSRTHPLRQALKHPGIDLAGAFERRLVGVDEDVDRGQIAH
jgi:hypothetical protein